MLNSQLLKIAENFGSPVYVYDAEKIAFQYHRLTDAFKEVKNLKINYAVKALSNISVLKYFNTLGAGIDTVSIQEVQLGLAAGFLPEQIIFTPNGVSLFEIEEATKLGVQINIDNISIDNRDLRSNSSAPIIATPARPGTHQSTGTINTPHCQSTAKSYMKTLEASTPKTPTRTVKYLANHHIHPSLLQTMI